MIRPVTASDSDAIAGIYNHYILNTAVTFEEQAVLATGKLHYEAGQFHVMRQPIPGAHHVIFEFSSLR